MSMTTTGTDGVDIEQVFVIDPALGAVQATDGDGDKPEAVWISDGQIAYRLVTGDQRNGQISPSRRPLPADRPSSPARPRPTTKPRDGLWGRRERSWLHFVTNLSSDTIPRDGHRYGDRSTWGCPSKAGVQTATGEYVSPFAPAIALVPVQLIWFGMPMGAVDPRRRARPPHRTAGDGHGARLPGQPRRQLRPGRPRVRRRPRSPSALILFSGLPYLLGFGVGWSPRSRSARSSSSSLVRRFAKAPRLVLTVATIGITQLLAVLGAARAAHVGRERRLAAHPAAVRLEADDRHVHPQRQRPDRPDRGPVGDDRASRCSSARTRLGTAVRGARRAERAGRRCSASPWPAVNTRVGDRRRPARSSPCSCAPASSACPIGFAAQHRAAAAAGARRTRHRPPASTCRRWRSPAVALGILEYGVALERRQPAARLRRSWRRGAASPCCCSAASTAGADNDDAATWQAQRRGPPARARRAPAPAGASDARRRRRADPRRRASLDPALLRVDQHHQGVGRRSCSRSSGCRSSCSPAGPDRSRSGRWASSRIGAAVSRHVHVAMERRPHARAARSAALAGAVVAFAVGLPALRLRGPVPRRHDVRLRARRRSRGCSTTCSSVGSRSDQRFERPPLFGRIDIEHADPLLRVHARRARRSSTSPLRGIRAQPHGPGDRRACARTSAPRRAIARPAGARQAHRVRDLRRRRRHRRRAVRAPQPVASASPATARARASTCSPSAVIGGLGRSPVRVLGACTCAARMVHHVAGVAVAVVGGRRAAGAADPARRARRPRGQAPRPLVGYIVARRRPSRRTARARRGAVRTGSTSARSTRTFRASTSRA